MTGPDPRELRTKAGTTESPRTRIVRTLNADQHVRPDDLMVLALLHIGDQLARIADRAPELATQLDQITASAADIAAAVEQPIPEEGP